MARYYIPRLTDSQPETDVDGIEALVAECWHIASNTAPHSLVHEPGESFRACVALINLSTVAHSRAVFRSLRHAVEFARTRSRSFAPSDQASLLDWCAPARRSDFATVIVHADDTTAATSAAMQALVDRVNDKLMAEATRVLLVCDDPMRWQGIKGVAGYVKRVGPANIACTAASLYLLMAADIAPHTASCVDWEDSGLHPDAPHAAAVLAQAAWFGEAGPLRYASAEDHAAVAHAQTVLLLPLMGEFTLAKLRAVCHTVRADLGPQGALVYAAPVGLDPLPALHERIATVLFLCSPALEAS